MSTTNNVNLQGLFGVNIVSFTWDNNSCITAGQDFGGVGVNNHGFEAIVRVSANRKGSKDCVPSFNRFVSSDIDQLIEAQSSPKLPTNLNFWVTGKLTVNTESFDVILAMGTGNNWFLGSPSMSDSNTLGNFTVRTSGSHTFEFSTN